MMIQSDFHIFQGVAQPPISQAVHPSKPGGWRVSPSQRWGRNVGDRGGTVMARRTVIFIYFVMELNGFIMIYNLFLWVYFWYNYNLFLLVYNKT